MCKFLWQCSFAQVEMQRMVGIVVGCRKVSGLEEHEPDRGICNLNKTEGSKEGKQ